VSANKNNEISKSFIVNTEEIINCNVSESVIKFATPGKDLKVDESTTVVVKEMPLPTKTDAINIDEIRDYSWIKSMNKTRDEGFANEYKNNYR